MKVVQLSLSGKFANQCITYAFGMELAERYNAELQTEYWYGIDLFKDVANNPISGEADYCVSGTPFDSTIFEPHCDVAYFHNFLTFHKLDENGKRVHDIRFTKTQLRKWFEFKDEYKIDSCFENVFHVRHWNPNESNWNGYPATNISRSSYIKAMIENGFDIKCFEEVSDYRPHDKIIVPDRFSFIEDFQILTQAKVMLRANSSFSWLAGVLGNGRVFSPQMEGVAGGWLPQDVEFKENNCGSFWPGSFCGLEEVKE